MLELNMSNNYEQEWQTFLSKIYDYAKDEAKDWTSLTLLSYFLVKYKSVNGLDFVFTLNKKGPTKSKEMRDAAKIWKMFDRDRYKQISSKEEKLIYKEQLVAVLKEYVCWAFDVKFRGRQTNVTGLGIFAVANFMNEFLQWRKARKSALPRRSDPLPSTFLAWVEANAAIIWKKQQLAVLEDLNALYNYVEAYDPGHISVEAVVLEKARELGIMPKEGKLELDKKQ